MTDIDRSRPNPNCDNCDGYGSGIFSPNGPCGACWPSPLAESHDALYYQLVLVFDALAQCDPGARERTIGRRTRNILDRAKQNMEARNA